MRIIDRTIHFLSTLGDALFFLGKVFGNIVSGRVRVREVLKQSCQQGAQSLVIVGLASFASGAVLGLQGYFLLAAFGAKEQVAHLVALSLVRELGPVFTAFIFSGKAGARITAELGTMSVNDQITATRTLGVDPVEFLVVPRMLACFLALPILTVFADIVGIFGGYTVGVFDAHIPSATYIHTTIRAVGYVDFFSGFVKSFVFAVLVGWITCYKGYTTTGGSTGVGKYTTEAVALSYIVVVVSNVFLTKIILTFWG